MAAWISWSKQPRAEWRLPDGSAHNASLAVRNASPVPVYNVEVTYFEGEVELGPQHFHVISPTGSTAHYREIKCDGMYATLARPRADDVRLDLRVQIAFTDAEGTRWVRNTTGTMHRVKE